LTKSTNEVTVTFRIPVFSDYGITKVEKFKGNSTVTFSEYVLHCFYKKNFTEKERIKYGIKDNATIFIYVSPIELNSVYGSYEFDSDIVVGKSKMELKLFDRTYFLTQIDVLEPVNVSGNIYSMAFQLRATNKENIY
jgi:hypothetical protein